MPTSPPSTSSASLSSAPLTGRVALLTGLSRRVGIGAGIARRLLDDGATLFASGWTAHDAEMPWGADSGGREALLAELDPPGDRFHYAEADLSLPETAARLVGQTIERFGHIDIVVANHARSSHDGLRDVSAEELDRCWATNARASVLLAKELLAQRSPGPGGRLILFTSGQHIGPMGDEIAYAVSKGAIHQMTASLSDQMIDSGISVNCINPGPIDTGYAKGDRHRAIASMFPARRWGQPADVARLVSWLVSDEAEWITGHVIDNEGGFRRWQGPEPERG